MNRIPKFVKFRYKSRERLWLKVEKVTDKSYIGAVANDPTEKGLKFGDHRRVLKTNIFDTEYSQQFNRAFLLFLFTSLICSISSLYSSKARCLMSFPCLPPQHSPTKKS